MMKKTVLILGGTGMLGNAVGKYFQQLPDYEVWLTTRDKSLAYGSSNWISYDPTGKTQDASQTLTDVFAQMPRNPDYVICAVGTIKPFMDQNPRDAIYINSLLPHELAATCRALGVKMIHVTSDCFVPETEVMTSLGNKMISEVKEGDYVFTHNGSLSKVESLVTTISDCDLVVITSLGSALPTKCSSNHPFLSIKRQGPKSSFKFEDKAWNPAGELSVGDLIAIPKITLPEENLTIKLSDVCPLKFGAKHAYLDVNRRFSEYIANGVPIMQSIEMVAAETNTNKRKIWMWVRSNQKPRVPELDEFEINEDIAWLLGVFVAEGWAFKIGAAYGATLSFGDEPELMTKACSVLKKQFKLNPRIRKMKGQKGSQVTIRDSFLSRYFYDFFYTSNSERYSHTKRIPMDLFRLPTEQKKAFLRGYFDGDGCSSAPKVRHKNPTIIFSSVSKVLSDGIRTMLMGLGFLPNSNISLRKPEIMGRTVNAKPAHTVTLSGPQASKFEEIVLGSAYRTKVGYQKFFEDNENWYVPISDISSEPYIGILYNLDVESDHSYLVNGGLSAHNCVFSGSVGKYVESDLHDALDAYGKSKSLGETKECMVIRTSILGEEIHKNASLVAWAKSQAGKNVSGFTNHIWNGITTKQFANCCHQIIEKDLYEAGLHHVFSNDVTKFELLSMIDARFGLNLTIASVEAGQRCDRTMRTNKTLMSRLTVPSISDQIKDM
jgi:dTDP-4-dehydrorhamnose reductase/intein/homing endonuclease